MHTNGVINKRIVVVGGLSAFLICASIYLVPTSSSAPPSPPPPQPVTVMNTTTNPVPVVQQGPVSISPGSSVKISTSGQIVRIHADMNTSSLTLSIYTVPVGKRLLINFVSVFGSANGGRVQTGLEIIKQDSSFFYQVGIPLAEQTNGTATSVNASFKTEIVVNAGDTLEAVLLPLFGATVTADVSITAIGTLVDATDTTIDVSVSNLIP